MIKPFKRGDLVKVTNDIVPIVPIGETVVILELLCNTRTRTAYYYEALWNNRKITIYQGKHNSVGPTGKPNSKEGFLKIKNKQKNWTWYV